MFLLLGPRPQDVDRARFFALCAPAASTMQTTIWHQQYAEISPRSRTLPRSLFFLRARDKINLSPTVFSTACPCRRSSFWIFIGNASDGSRSKKMYEHKNNIANLCRSICVLAHFTMLATNSCLIQSFGRVSKCPALSTAFLELSKAGC